MTDLDILVGGVSLIVAAIIVNGGILMIKRLFCWWAGSHAPTKWEQEIWPDWNGNAHRFVVEVETCCACGKRLRWHRVHEGPYQRIAS